MAEDFSEQFACPVCFDIPVAEIFQCINGHTVCSLCSNIVRKCPQCRIPFGQDKIRNRALEVILDGRKFPCPNREVGCTKVVSRRDLAEHSKLCEFQELKIHICQTIGLTCSFTTSNIKIPELIRHFSDLHNFSPVYYDGLTGQIKLANFQKAALNITSIYTPIFLKETCSEHEYSSKFIALAKVNGRDQTLSFVASYLGLVPSDHAKYTAKFIVSSGTAINQPLEWTIPVIGLGSLESAVNAPVFRVSGSFLKRHSTADGHLHVSVLIKKETEVNAGPIDALERGTQLCFPLEKVPDAEKDKPRRGNVLSTDAEYVSRGVFCDGCDTGSEAIKGTRYHCLQCEDYDLCRKCMEAGAHSHHLFTPITNDAERMALTKLKYDSVLGSTKPLLTGDITVGAGPLVCDECSTETSLNNKLAVFCVECQESRGVCETCCKKERVSNICKRHSYYELNC